MGSQSPTRLAKISRALLGWVYLAARSAGWSKVGEGEHRFTQSPTGDAKGASWPDDPPIRPPFGSEPPLAAARYSPGLDRLQLGERSEPLIGPSPKGRALRANLVREAD